MSILAPAVRSALLVLVVGGVALGGILTIVSILANRAGECIDEATDALEHDVMQGPPRCVP